jgi:hypothetical protein
MTNPGIYVGVELRLRKLESQNHFLQNRNTLGAIRTHNLLLRKQLLYPLSYEGGLRVLNSIL